MDGHCALITLKTGPLRANGKQALNANLASHLPLVTPPFSACGLLKIPTSVARLSPASADPLAGQVGRASPKE